LNSDPPSRSSRASRFSAGLPASALVDGKDTPCRACDLSRTGVKLLWPADRPLPAAELSLTISSWAGDLRLTVAGRVARRDLDPESPETLLGVEFLGIHDADRQTLEALIARVVEGTSSAWLEDLPDNAKPREVRAALEKVPLPHRIQWAAHGQPGERDRLIQDPSLQVLDSLARNPNLLLHEVLAILRKRNLLPHTLEVIGRDGRWSAAEQVQVLVATHRSTPLALAVSLTSRMSAATLQRVIQAPDLNPALRAKILHRLPRR